MKAEYDKKRKQMRDDLTKRFYLFAWDSEDPCGGTSDIVGTYNTLNDARASFKEHHGWAKIDVGSTLDMETGDVTILGKPRRLNQQRLYNYGIEVTGTWYARTSEYKWVASQRTWDRIKNMSVQQFRETPNIRGIGRATRRKVLENVMVMG